MYNIVSQSFGWAATASSLTYKIPQIRHLYKIKKSDGLNATSLYIQAASYIFLIVHGTIIEDLPIIVMGIISLLQSIFLIVLYWHCVANEKRRTPALEPTVEELRLRVRGSLTPRAGSVLPSDCALPAR